MTGLAVTIGVVAVSASVGAALGLRLLSWLLRRQS